MGEFGLRDRGLAASPAIDLGQPRDAEPITPAAKGAADPYRVYEIVEGIYWVGFADWDAGFSNNPYLIVSGDEAALIDPGSVLHYHVVAKKVRQVIHPRQITDIVLLHQDPDLCASVPKFEALIEHPIRVVTHPLTALFLPYYGITSEFVTPGDGDTLTIAGRELQFFHVPYVHFVGTMVIWEASTGTLFASDVFAALTRRWGLFADSDYVEATRAFVEPYVGSRRAWLSALELIRSLSPKRLCPQHGSIIDEDIDGYLDALSQFRVGRMLPTEPEVARE